MKFGEYLLANKAKEWEDKYLDYDRMDKMITLLEEKHVAAIPVRQQWEFILLYALIARMSAKEPHSQCLVPPMQQACRLRIP